LEKLGWIPPVENRMYSTLRKQDGLGHHKKEVEWIPSLRGSGMVSTTRRKWDGFNLKK